MKEVDGVAGQIAIGPTPVRRLDEDALAEFRLEVAAARLLKHKLTVRLQRRDGGYAPQTENRGRSRVFQSFGQSG